MALFRSLATGEDEEKPSLRIVETTFAREFILTRDWEIGGRITQQKFRLTEGEAREVHARLSEFLKGVDHG